MLIVSKGFHPVTLRWVTEVGETREMVTLFMLERFRSWSEAWNGFARRLGIRSDTPPSIELGGESDCTLRSFVCLGVTGHACCVGMPIRERMARRVHIWSCGAAGGLLPWGAMDGLFVSGGARVWWDALGPFLEELEGWW